jgi:DNA-binding ferritin-like protein
MNKINELLNRLLELSMSSRFWHWITTSHAEHTSLGDFYEQLNVKLDAFVEVSQGAYGSRVKVPADISIIPYVSRMERLRAISTYLSACIEQCEDESIANIIAEILADVNKLKYLLTQN